MASSRNIIRFNSIAVNTFLDIIKQFKIEQDLLTILLEEVDDLYFVYPPSTIVNCYMLIWKLSFESKFLSDMEMDKTELKKKCNEFRISLAQLFKINLVDLIKTNSLHVFLNSSDKEFK